MLSEDADDDPARLGASRVWIVDPLDGTKESGEGREDWAVHVALVAGGEPAAGAVSLPCLARKFSTSPVSVVPAREPGRRLRTP